MTTDTQKLDEMITAIKYETEGIHGGRPAEIAKEWVDNGFDAATAQPWWDAYCFDAGSAAELRDAGIDPADVAANHTDGRTIGYWHSNSDLSVAQVKELVDVYDEH